MEFLGEKTSSFIEVGVLAVVSSESLIICLKNSFSSQGIQLVFLRSYCVPLCSLGLFSNYLNSFFFCSNFL